ncbi:ACT domain protein [Peptococcaceae bacterium CEB3]|nr:ACT domain protein [Peptococcaceae bacterium CEB3]
MQRARCLVCSCQDGREDIWGRTLLWKANPKQEFEWTQFKDSVLGSNPQSSRTLEVGVFCGMLMKAQRESTGVQRFNGRYGEGSRLSVDKGVNAAMLQLSIFLENTKGRLAEVLNLLAELGVNVRALSLADTKDYGVLRLMVASPEKVAAELRQKNCVVSLTPVFVLEVPDEAGGLAGVLNRLVPEGVEVEYMYAFVEKAREKAQVVIRVQDNQLMERAMKKLGLAQSPQA